MWLYCGLRGFAAFAAKQKTPREYARGLRADVPGLCARALELML
jgi:hypothetical protein